MHPFDRLISIMQELRQKCPWDKRQTHESLKKYALEEVYELLDAIDSEDPRKLKEELGDILLQVVFHSQIAKEEGRFDIHDVIEHLCSKLIGRHPHVFGSECAEDVLKNWEHRKAQERESILDGIPKNMPALLRSRKLQDRASSVGFDFQRVEQALEKIQEEIQELKESLENKDEQNLEHELGDILTAVVELGRLLGIDAELALHRANERFEKRFRMMERMARQMGKDLRSMSLEEMDELWKSAKKMVG